MTGRQDKPGPAAKPAANAPRADLASDTDRAGASARAGQDSAGHSHTPHSHTPHSHAAPSYPPDSYPSDVYPAPGADPSPEAAEAAHRQAEWEAYAARYGHRPARGYDQEQDAYREGYDAENPRDWADAPAAHATAMQAADAQAARRLLGCSQSRVRGQCQRLVDFFARLFAARAFRRAVLALLVAGVVSAAGFGAVWWRLGAGPINLDILTPWLASAIGDNFGKDHRVEIGGTQIERAGRIRMALRIRDVVVRDKDNAIVAIAPKAEVRMSGTRLLMGRLRAESLSLVGAELAVRIEPDGRVIVSAGGDARPLATSTPAQTSPATSAAPSSAPSAPAAGTPDESARGGMHGLLAALAWIDGLGVSGLDGHDLNELGLKNGYLVVDDRQSGRTWKFDNITLVLRRPGRGGVALRIGEESEDNPWSLAAVVGPPVDGVRGIDLIANKVSAESLLLALRMNDMAFTADMPISGRIRGQIGRDGLPTFLSGQIIAESGTVTERKLPEYPMTIDRAEIGVEWDAARRTMVAPFQILSGTNRITLLAHLEPPNDRVPHWQMGLSGGTILLATPDKSESLIFNRVAIRVQFDTDRRRVVLERGDISNGDIGFAGSGHLDYSGSEPRLVLGFAGTPMPASAVKLSWPVTVAPEVREWVLGHVGKGAVQRLDIGINAPVKTLVRGGPPIPEDGLSVDVAASGVSLQPVASLPPLNGADLRVRVSGRTASVAVPQATLDTPGGRKLTLSDMLFEVPDTVPKPAQARMRFRVEGPVPAAAEVLAMDRLAEFSGAPVDANTAKGTVNAAVSLALPLKRDLAPGETSYALNVDLANFAAEKMVLGQKLEATALKVTASAQGLHIKGDVKIGGLPAALDYRKPRGEGDADVRLTAVTDDAARARLGFSLASNVTGPVTLKLAGKIAAADRDSRYAIEADLTAARVDNLLPGWLKVAGRPGRAQFTLIQKPQATRFEDVVIDGGGTLIKGTLEVNANGDLIHAAFPTYHPSDADKASLRAERAADGTLKVVMRGEVFDGRGFVKSAVAGSGAASKQKSPNDIDIDLKLGAVAGYHGEAVRALDIKMARRGGVLRSFALSGKIGRDSPMIGDLRGRAGGRDVLYLEANDAGAFFRFTDTYPKMHGGQMWVAMDPPNNDPEPKEGLLNVRDFTIRGEGALDRVVANAGHGGAGVPFSRMRVEFTRQTGLLTVHDGVVRGPTIGATIDGTLDYASDRVQMRGTFVPLYGLNNMFGQIPIVGVFLGGGSNEGLLGLTYEVVGSPGAPVLRVNPISAVAPGLLRKFFEFPTGRGGAATPPAPDRPQ